MLGAIIGDISGSIYEFDQAKKCHPIKIDGSLISEDSFFSDDTILTIAILDAILSTDAGKTPHYEHFLRSYGTKFIDRMPKTNAPHFSGAFSTSFVAWLKQEDAPYVGKSNDNGALMRISPVAYLFDDFHERLLNSDSATKPSHDTIEATNGAFLLTEVIYLARQGLNGQKIAETFNLDLNYKPFKHFNQGCCETLGPCLAVALSADGFESAIRTIISLGGDTDTNACIVGSIAEALFGIPKNLKSQALKKLPHDFIELLEKGYK